MSINEERQTMKHATFDGLELDEAFFWLNRWGGIQRSDTLAITMKWKHYQKIYDDNEDASAIAINLCSRHVDD